MTVLAHPEPSRPALELQLSQISVVSDPKDRIGKKDAEIVMEVFGIGDGSC